jgi:uncharacterized protein (TIGR04562 family)
MAFLKPHGAMDRRPDLSDACSAIALHLLELMLHPILDLASPVKPGSMRIASDTLGVPQSIEETNHAASSWIPVGYPLGDNRNHGGGKSALDIPRLDLHSPDEADRFLQAYGLRELDSSITGGVEGLRQEAMTFLEKEILQDEPTLKMDAEVILERDLRILLLWASSPHLEPRRHWACALLRVMHTMANSTSFFTRVFAHEIEAQIRNRVEPHLHSSLDGLKLGQGAEGIPLAHFEMRGSKSPHSILMKLLQKREHLASDIYDHVGMRFVTQNRFDALLVARYLRVNNIVMFAHIHSSRCRNSLLDLSSLRTEMAEAHKRFVAGKITDAQRLALLRQQAAAHPYPSEAQPSSNPYSSVNYHALQFTCRQSISVRNPGYQHLEEQIRDLQAANPAITTQLAPLIASLELERDWHFFFPFEVQIMDQESYEMAHSGQAAHHVYKARQREAVKRRLLGPLLNPKP